MDAMCATMKGLRDRHPDVCAVGLGMPGWVDFYKGVLYQLTNVAVWDREVPVRDVMQQQLGLPVVLDNDANCMGYAEWKLGAGQGLESLVCLTLGTGIGGAVIVHNRLLRGRNVSSGELGQTSIHFRGRVGPFGNRGAIEEYIGNNELAAEAVARYAAAGVQRPAEDCTPYKLELAARVNAVLRRSGGNASLVRGNLTLDEDTMTATLRGVKLELNNKEFNLLKYLMQKEGKALTRENILNAVWGYDEGETRTVDNHVARLRKLGIDYIETVFGVGYKFVYRE